MPRTTLSARANRNDERHGLAAMANAQCKSPCVCPRLTGGTSLSGRSTALIRTARRPLHLPTNADSVEMGVSMVYPTFSPCARHVARRIRHPRKIRNWEAPATHWGCVVSALPSTHSLYGARDRISASCGAIYCHHHADRQAARALLLSCGQRQRQRRWYRQWCASPTANTAKGASGTGFGHDASGALWLIRWFSLHCQCRCRQLDPIYRCRGLR